MNPFKASRRDLIKGSILAFFGPHLGLSSKQVQAKEVSTRKDAFKLNREIPIVDKYDLVVAGGGPSGVAAAICAARLDTKVLLVETLGCLVGAGTSGLFLPGRI